MLACIYIWCHVVGEKMREHGYDTDRNRAFDLLRIVCTFIIIIHHTEIFYGALNRGYIAVEFFFMSSGFFLYKSYRNHPEEGTIHYFVKRAKRLYPEYWFAYIILFLAHLVMHSVPYTHWYSPILELFLLQNVGIPLDNAAMNYPCWYLSVLLFGGTFIYFLLKKLKRIYNIVSALVVIGTYTLLISQAPYIEQWGYVAGVYLPFWRGLADMMIGIFICQAPKPRKLAGRLIELCSGLCILFMLRLNGQYDYFSVFLIILLIWAICSDEAILRRIGSIKFLELINRYQYGIYLNHICVILVFRHFNLFSSLNLFSILILLFGCTFLLAWAGKFIVSWLKVYGHKIRL